MEGGPKPEKENGDTTILEGRIRFSNLTNFTQEHDFSTENAREVKYNIIKQTCCITEYLFKLI